MALVLLDEFGDIVFVFDPLASLVESELLKGLDLGVSQRDTLGGQELSQDIVSDLASTIGVHNAEG